MELTYKYRLYPNQQQEKRIAEMSDKIRFLYNKMLEDRTKHYRKTRTWKKLDWKAFRNISFLAEVDDHTMAWTQNNLERAYRHFFHVEQTELDRYRPESVSKAESSKTYPLLDNDLIGYPRYKKKKDRKTYYTTYLENLTVQNNRITLPSVGIVKIRYHRPLPADAEQICTTVIKKPAGRYYLLIQLKIPDVNQRVVLERPMGIVYVPGQLAVRSDEVPVEFRHLSKEQYKQLQKAYQTLRRRTPGSKRYEKQRRYLASLHEHRKNQRRDDLHKAARQITNAADAFYLQKPEVLKQITEANSSLKRAVMLDEAWWTFSSLLQYKVRLDGKQFWKVPRAFPTYTSCSACDYWSRMDDAGGDWICPQCGKQVPRHMNAAGNLERLAAKYVREQKEVQSAQ